MVAIEQPTWTVHANTVFRCSPWVGTAWYFFSDEKNAERCYQECLGRGWVPTKRPFNAEHDAPHLGAAHHMGGTMS